MQDPRNRKRFGYRSMVYGDQSTQLVNVAEDELDVDERMTLDLALKYHEERHLLNNRKHQVGLKPSEKGRLAELEALIDELRSSCRHRVFYDEDGFMYYTRSCVCCGAHMGLV